MSRAAAWLSFHGQTRTLWEVFSNTKDVLVDAQRSHEQELTKSLGTLEEFDYDWCHDI